MTERTTTEPCPQQLSYLKGPPTGALRDLGAEALLDEWCPVQLLYGGAWGHARGREMKFEVILRRRDSGLVHSEAVRRTLSSELPGVACRCCLSCKAARGTDTRSATKAADPAQ